MGVLGRLDLPGIGGRHGVYGVRAENGPFKQIDVPVHHQRAVIRPAPVQAEQILQRLSAEAALILDVVNGEHGANVPQPQIQHAQIPQINGNQRRLPVVAVNDVWRSSQHGKNSHDRPGKEAEAFPVVVVAVKLRALKILFIVQKVPGHTVFFHLEQPAVGMAPREINIGIAQIFHLIAEFFPHGLIQRQDDGCLRTASRQRRRQRARHIRKSACFAEGSRLTGGIQNFHSRSSSPSHNQTILSFSRTFGLSAVPTIFRDSSTCTRLSAMT
jgi:hypothetical protein